MRPINLWGGVAALAALLVPATAHAQIFTSFQPSSAVGAAAPEPRPEPSISRPLPLPAETPGAVGEVKDDKDVKDEKYDDYEEMRHARFDRLQLGGYYSNWSDLNAFFPTNPVFLTEEDGGYLVSGEFWLGRRWSIGGYYNRFDGDVRYIVDKVGPGSVAPIVASTEMHAFDAHIMYYLPANFALQAGWVYSRLCIENRDNLGPNLSGVAESEIESMGPSFWLLNATPVADLGGGRTIDLFGGAGMQSSQVFRLEAGGQEFEPGFDFVPRAQAIVGMSIALTRNLKANGSVWAANIDDRPSTRYNVGLSGSF